MNNNFAIFAACDVPFTHGYKTASAKAATNDAGPRVERTGPLAWLDLALWPLRSAPSAERRSEVGDAHDRLLRARDSKSG
jgi:hypothetical protein